MVITLLLLSALAGLFRAAEGQDIRVGACPSRPVQQNFNVTKFLGVWYEIEKIRVFVQKDSCTLHNYTQMENGNMRIVNKEIRPDGSVDERVGIITQRDPTEPAKMEVKFGLWPTNPYTVLATDYDNYAITFSCITFLYVSHVDNAWILSRNRSLPPETMTYLRTILTSNDIHIDNLKPTDQENCPTNM